MRQSNHAIWNGKNCKGMYNGHVFAGVVKKRMVVDHHVTHYFINLNIPITSQLGTFDTICFVADVRDEKSEYSNTHYIDSDWTV